MNSKGIFPDHYEQGITMLGLYLQSQHGFSPRERSQIRDPIQVQKWNGRLD